MNHERRVELAETALSGYPNGPEASLVARARGLSSLAGSHTVVLVEGVSDQIALDTLAARQGRDLAGEGVTVLPAGGAHEINKLMADMVTDRGKRLLGLCDAAEEAVVRHGMRAAGLGSPVNRTEVEALGFQVCVEDLEDELIRALGAEHAIAVLETQGDSRSFERLQLQPAWRDRPVEDQLRRFIGSGARRKLRYARLLAGSIDMTLIPGPIGRLLAEL